MKINKIIYMVMLVLVLTTMCGPNISYANNININNQHNQVSIQDGGGGGGSSKDSDSSNSSVAGDSSTGLPSIDSSYRPSVTMPSGGATRNIIESILSVLTTLGVIAIVVSIALIGFNTILGSASEKAHNQEKYVGLIIAALLITGGSVIVKLIINIAEKI